MTDGFRVCVFVPVAGDGDASAGIQAAIKIAREFECDVQIHPIALHPNPHEGVNDQPGTVRIAKGRFEGLGVR